MVGFYVHQNDLPGLQKAVLKRVVGEQATAATMIERDQMRKVLLDGGEEGERVWREVLMNMEGEGWRSAWRIVPTRNTGKSLIPATICVNPSSWVL